MKKAKEHAETEAEVDSGQISLFGAFSQSSNASDGPPTPHPQSKSLRLKSPPPPPAAAAAGGHRVDKDDDNDSGGSGSEFPDEDDSGDQDDDGGGGYGSDGGGKLKRSY